MTLGFTKGFTMPRACGTQCPPPTPSRPSLRLPRLIYPIASIAEILNVLNPHHPLSYEQIVASPLHHVSHYYCLLVLQFELSADYQ